MTGLARNRSTNKPHVQVGVGPSKSAKKKAKKKAAAARKADAADTDGTEGVGAAGSNGEPHGAAKSSGQQHADTSGTTGTKGKIKGMTTAKAHTYAQHITEHTLIFYALNICSHWACCIVGKKSMVQTDPPTVPVADLLPGGTAPEGEWQSYKDE